jgi:transposase-like protein
MVNYNIVKHCGLCKVRFVVDKSQARKHFCDACQKRIEREQRDEVRQE